MSTTSRIPAAVLLAATFLFPYFAQAMEIQEFDKMTGPDQDEYISEMVSGAEKVLNDQGKPALSSQVHKLFTTNAPDGNISIGMAQFMTTLAMARVADIQRANQDPHARRLEVEDAMAVMLKKNSIDLPQAFFTVASSFKPKHSGSDNKK